MPTTADLVRRAYAALAERDFETLSELAVPDFELDVSDRVLNPAVYEGHEGIRQFYDEVSEVWESFSWEPLEIKELESGTVAVIHSKGVGRGSGLELDRRAAMVWRVEAGRVLALTFYRDPAAAMQAATGAQ